MAKIPVFFIINSVLLVIFILVALLQMVFPNVFTGRLFEISYTGSVALMAILSLIAASSINNWHKMLKVPATLLSVALVCSAAGDIIWFYLSNFLQIEIPYPSIADVWYILFYPITYLALLVLLVYLSNRDKQFGWVINGSTIISALLIILGGILTKYLYSANYTPENYENLVVIFDNLYIICDGLLLAHLIVVAFFAFVVPKSEQKLLSSLIAVGVGMIFTLIADTVFAYLAEIQAYAPGSFVDVLFLLGVYSMTFAVAKLVIISKESNLASSKLLNMS